ncbi:uncharacterized protein B0H64DRAFT_372899 [Chaetomium fimeti]|uniref:Zn(2)-C6 fungal-type domain-containing protein n=1 Tax=Chaetomium fimeti TaxID=1854472 RepID=A0AAE0HJA4_9PEZI|nr:hypothetical protein B0H64DRAFT_372899 [Chaetomium fimeti]
MAQPLKRTFHGCLTCRRRKVRCLGGSPCPNCSKMNIACHSSFETNLRVRVATATGQRDLQTKSPTGKPSPLPEAPTASARTLFDAGAASAFAVHNASDTAVDTNVWGTQTPSAPLDRSQRTDFDPALFLDPWCFSIPSPAGPSFQVTSCSQVEFPATEPSIWSPLHFDGSALGIPYFQPSNTVFGPESEISPSINAQSQEGMGGDDWLQYTAASHARS